MAVADLAAQLRVWEESGCERHISEALRRVYALLAGHVDEVTPSLGLDWRRALGLHLWYGCQPTATGAPLRACVGARGRAFRDAWPRSVEGVGKAPATSKSCDYARPSAPASPCQLCVVSRLPLAVSDALDSYASAVEAGAAPPPLPLYAEQAAGSGSGGSGPSGGAFDVAFELLRLHAVAADPDASGFPAALAPLLARLLRWARLGNGGQQRRCH